MASENENFILKEFIVGLIVLLALLFLLTTGASKFVKPFFKNLSLGKAKKIVKTETNCSSFPLTKDLKKDQKLEFERLIKRSGWLDQKFRYTLTYPVVEKNKIAYEINSSVPEILKEQNEILCTDQGITQAQPDKLLLSGFLNVYPEKLDSLAKFKVVTVPLFLLTAKNQWENNLMLKGGLVLSGDAKNADALYCFSLEAKGESVSSSEKIQTTAGEFATTKIVTNWEATPSAALEQLRKIDDCYQYSGSYGNSGKISLKEEIWFAPGLGIVKRHLTPMGQAGQIYFLPNGYLPLDITDEIVVK